MNYRIMIKTASGTKDQYQFLTYVNENGEDEVFESTSLADVDTKVEKMINGNYRKKDILVVSVWDFNAFADLYDNSKKPVPVPDPEPEPDNENENGENGDTTTEPENGNTTDSGDNTTTDPSGDSNTTTDPNSGTDPDPTTDPSSNTDPSGNPTTDPNTP